eukprot:gene15472-18365_t
MIPAGFFPNTIRSINFGPEYNQPLVPGALPQSLLKLEFGDEFNQPLGPSILPPNLLTIVVGNNFDQDILQGDLPDSLTEITFGPNFNRPLGTGVLPGGLRRLILDNQFNSLLVLPPNVEYLNFGFNFNEPLNVETVPASVKTLERLRLMVDYENDLSDVDFDNIVFPRILDVLNFQESREFFEQSTLEFDTIMIYGTETLHSDLTQRPMINFERTSHINSLTKPHYYNHPPSIP